MSPEERDKLRAEWSAMSYSQLATVYRQIDGDIKELKQLMSQAQKLFDLLTKEVLPDKINEDGFRNVPLKEGGRFQPSVQAHCSVRAGMKPDLFNWLHEHEFDDLVTEVVNPSTLKSFIKEQLQAGNPVPSEEVVNYEPYTRVTLVKS